MTFTHGASGYTNFGCRCQVCREGNREAAARHREKRRAARVLVDGRLVAPGPVKHGSGNTYSNHGCRCDSCTDAATAERAYDRRREAK